MERELFLYEKRYLHAKTICADSTLCSVGWTNIDIRSFSINYELNAVLYSERLTRELEQDFERDLAYCTQFDMAKYQQRNAVIRFRDSSPGSSLPCCELHMNCATTLRRSYETETPVAM
jgi:cardiolipin synthase